MSCCCIKKPHLYILDHVSLLKLVAADNMDINLALPLLLITIFSYLKSLSSGSWWIFAALRGRKSSSAHRTDWVGLRSSSTWTVSKFSKQKLLKLSFVYLWVTLWRNCHCEVEHPNMDFLSIKRWFNLRKCWTCCRLNLILCIKVQCTARKSCYFIVALKTFDKSSMCCFLLLLPQSEDTITLVCTSVKNISDLLS